MEVGWEQQVDGEHQVLQQTSVQLSLKIEEERELADSDQKPVLALLCPPITLHH